MDQHDDDRNTEDRSVNDLLAAAHAGADGRYDLIAARFVGLSPFGGPVPLRTLAGETREQGPPEALRREHLKHLRDAAQPLSFEVEHPDDGRLGYEFTAHQVRLRFQDSSSSVLRRTSLAYPPAFLSATTYPHPAQRLVGQQIQSAAVGQLDFRWLPFDALLEQGRFVRMQLCDRLVEPLEPDAFYLFVSHRWLDLADPDPDGGQAAMVAWQLVARLVEAVWVRAARWPDLVRMRFPGTSIHLGPHGSGLAESMAANLLGSIDAHGLAELRRDAEAFDDIEIDGGIAMAHTDAGLAGLRARLSTTPALARLLGRVRLWYDFNCMPQHPRSAAEQERFEALLRRLGIVQMLGRTVVLLDDVADYFGRGWCSYESLLAGDRLSGALDVWAGSRAAGIASGVARDAFLRVLTDRPHLVWRAILDTEVFGLQTPGECMARLDLRTTRPEDLSIVYRLFRTLGMPSALHFEDGEVLTGVFPLPVRANQAVVIGHFGRRVDAARLLQLRSLPAPFGALELVAVGADGLPAWEEFDTPADLADGTECRVSRPAAHVAVMAACEGEAVALRQWISTKRQRLEDALDVRIASLSWLASDVAPVGHFGLGTLAVRPVVCDLWIVAGSEASLASGYAAGLLIETLWQAGLDHAELVIGADGGTNNLRVHVGKPAGGEATDVDADADANPELALRCLDLDDPILLQTCGAKFRPRFMSYLGVGR